MVRGQGFSDFFYSAQDGLRLHARLYGEEDSGRLPVVCLPGLTRNARDFHDLAIRLSSSRDKPRRVISFDYRGRGQSDYDRNWQNYSVATEATDVVDGLIALGITGAAFIGTSRGGLIVHILAAMRPALLKAIVLNDIGPVIEPTGLAHIRSYLETSPRPADFDQAVTIQRGIHGPAFPALSKADWQRFVRAIYRDDNGKPVPDFDPKLLKTVSAMDLDRPLPDLWPQFEAMAAVAVLALRGANSRLLSAATLEQMSKRHPRCETVTVQGQGHAPLLETGDLPERIAAFMDAAESGGR
ncbi:alpha/beta hydrolase [Mesorhizobium sp. CC13]|uniref:alpha/beta fold hydrolase n=1 Tax=Mesorhizobium sp. CC13 TaxID=3029194 RepID=UPI003265BEFB